MIPAVSSAGCLQSQRLTDDELAMVRGLHDRGLIRSSAWPMLAAELLARGMESDQTVELAGLSRLDSAWLIDPLVPGVIEDLGEPRVPPEVVDRIVGRAIARAVLRRGCPEPLTAIRVLASFSPGLDYPGGVIGEAYSADEWVDCECHRDSPERASAEALAAALLNEPLDVDDQLVDAATADLVKPWLTLTEGRPADGGAPGPGSIAGGPDAPVLRRRPSPPTRANWSSWRRGRGRRNGRRRSGG